MEKSHLPETKVLVALTFDLHVLYLVVDPQHLGKDEVEINEIIFIVKSHDYAIKFARPKGPTRKICNCH